VTVYRPVCNFQMRIKIAFYSYELCEPCSKKSIKPYWSEICQICQGKKIWEIHIAQSLYFSSLGKGRVSRDFFYYVSVIINYDFDLSVFIFPKSGVKNRLNLNKQKSNRNKQKTNRNKLKTNNLCYPLDVSVLAAALNVSVQGSLCSFRTCLLSKFLE